MSRAWIALGANLGDREATLERALCALAPDAVVLRRSTWIETDPVGGPPQGRYLNGVVEVETALDPHALLDRLHEIETELGRERPADGTPNHPRTLDLDLLAHGDRVVDEPGLRVPHPRMHLRRFVLEPLVEIDPEWVHPELGRTARELLAGLDAGPASTGPDASRARTPGCPPRDPQREHAARRRRRGGTR